MPQIGQVPGPSARPRDASGRCTRHRAARAAPESQRGRAMVVRRRVGGIGGSGREETRRLGLEAFEAALAAEVMGDAVVYVVMRRALGIDGHAAHRVLHGLPHVRSLRRPRRTVNAWHGACSFAPMRTMLATLMLGWCWACGRGHGGAGAPRRNTARNGPARAERLADDVRRRLELPPAAGHRGLARRRRGWPRRERRLPAGAGRRRHHQREAARQAARRRPPRADGVPVSRGGGADRRRRRRSPPDRRADAHEGRRAVASRADSGRADAAPGTPGARGNRTPSASICTR